MEALTAVQVALPAIYDMCKAVDQGMVVTGGERKLARNLLPFRLITGFSQAPAACSVFPPLARVKVLGLNTGTRYEAFSATSREASKINDLARPDENPTLHVR